MIVLGDLSGIQNYLFDVADSGGGQARRLRARSFFLQVIPDLTAIRITRELGWGFESLRMAGAGKFVLQGPAPADADSRLQRLDRKPTGIGPRGTVCSSPKRVPGRPSR
ncbi:MAG: hypothetical protein HYU36_01775 [Planctomycetes bacterium]|nr:hypothetical protein [Planctomycetota bacterium]